MKLNLGLIADSLTASSYEYVSGNLESQPHLTSVHPFVSGFGTDSQEILYLMTWEQLKNIEDCPKDIACIGGGADALAFFNEHMITGIIYRADEEPLFIVRQLQEIFMKYHVMERELLDALLTDAPIRTILNCCARFFEGHVSIFSGNDFRLMEYSDNFLPADDNLFWKETVAQRRSAFPKGSRAKAKMLPSRPKDYPSSMFFNTGEEVAPHFVVSFDNGDYRFCTMTILETGKRFSKHQHWLVDHIAVILRPMMADRYNFSLSTRNSLRKTISDFLRQVTADVMFAENSLLRAGWKINDEYRIALILLPAESNNISHYIYNYENVFADDYSDCLALRFNEFIMILFHGSACSLSEDCRATLEKQLELDNGVCSVGIPFCDFSQLKAQYALTILPFSAAHDDDRIRYYEEMMPAHIINEVNSVFPLRSICHRAAVRVCEYDTANGTNYLLSLETYLLYNKSLIAAANRLFIHRSTMTYRLKCIEKIIDMNLDDPYERLWILLSCAALRVLKDKKQEPEKHKPQP